MTDAVERTGGNPGRSGHRLSLAGDRRDYPYMTEHGVVLFHTTSSVMRAEKLLIGDGPPLVGPRRMAAAGGAAGLAVVDRKDAKAPTPDPVRDFNRSTGLRYTLWFFGR